MSSEKQEKPSVWYRSYLGAKEIEKLSYFHYALEALVSETNFSIR